MRNAEFSFYYPGRHGNLFDIRLTALRISKKIADLQKQSLLQINRKQQRRSSGQRCFL
jgi:hypothetical protein